MHTDREERKRQRQREVLLSLLVRTLIPSRGPHPQDPNYLPEVPPPNTITMGIRASACGFWGDTALSPPWHIFLTITAWGGFSILSSADEENEGVKGETNWSRLCSHGNRRAGIWAWVGSPQGLPETPVLYCVNSRCYLAFLGSCPPSPTLAGRTTLPHTSLNWALRTRRDPWRGIWVGAGSDSNCPKLSQNVAFLCLFCCHLHGVVLNSGAPGKVPSGTCVGETAGLEVKLRERLSLLEVMETEEQINSASFSKFNYMSFLCSEVLNILYLHYEVQTLHMVATTFSRVAPASAWRALSPARQLHSLQNHHFLFLL